MYVPVLQDTLSTSPVVPLSWGVAIGVSVLIVPAVELHKWWWARRFTQDTAWPAGEQTYD